MERGNFNEGDGLSIVKYRDTVRSSAKKTTEPIEMPFGLWARMDPRNQVLDGGLDLHLGRGNFKGKGMARHARRHSAVSCVKMAKLTKTPKEACVSWGHIGATYQIRLNRPCAEAMRPCVKLL